MSSPRRWSTCRNAPRSIDIVEELRCRLWLAVPETGTPLVDVGDHTC
ncbi:MAG: hypothetical protein QOD83_181 [Solirubrobacteraceae bacterium]|jgi:hypothetical protein|nr:hypothetical protein [Solirubrobacteraceae bacterium]